MTRRTLAAATIAAALAAPAAAGATTGDGTIFSPYNLSCGAHADAPPGSYTTFILHADRSEAVYYVNWTLGGTQFRNPTPLFGGGTAYDIQAKNGSLAVGTRVGTWLPNAYGQPASVKADEAWTIKVVRWC